MEKQSSTGKNRVFVVGVGMTKFLKPTKTSPDYPELAKQAIERALRDAGVKYTDVQQACVGYVYGDSTCGQRALYEVGMTGIPILNVNNNCATGSSALYLAKTLVEGGSADCAMALGFERMSPGSLQTVFSDRASPLENFIGVMSELRDFESVPFAPQMFGNAGREHMEKYGTTQEQIAKIAHKNHLHSVNNPYSQFRDEYTLEQIMKSPTIYYPLTKLQCCPTSNGAACAIVCNEKFIKERGLEDQAVEILSMVMTTDYSSTFTDKSCIKIVGYDMAKSAAKKAYEQAGVTPNDVNVVELHDCFAANELITYEALGLCKEGEAGKFIDSGNNTYGGKYVVNPSGGLISKGHPLGATGLAQCAELTWQLRDMAEKRQVKGAKIALQHNLGLGGACVVGVYKKYNDNNGHKRTDQSSDPAILEKIESGTSRTSLAKL